MVDYKLLILLILKILLLFSVSLPDDAGHVEISGNIAFVANDDSGLQIIILVILQNQLLLTQ